MGEKSFFFAGGGTGGHIYPAVAVAEQIIRIEPDANIHFFCSSRSIDKHILGQTAFEYTVLPAGTFSLGPGRLVGFLGAFLKSYSSAKAAIIKSDKVVIVGVGGFVSGPVCLAGRKFKVPIALVNVDIVPGRANKIIARWADEIFVQFEETGKFFAKRKPNVNVVGCPLRSGFSNQQPNEAIKKLSLDSGKKTLLITGASSGSENINKTVCSLLKNLEAFAAEWQIVHLTGRGNFEKVVGRYDGAKIGHKVLGYFDDMADLLAAADLVVGRSGALSVAEYAVAGVPSICMPYPYHKDRHQYLNAGKLVEAGAAVIVDDVRDEQDRARWLWEELKELMTDHEKRRRMTEACKEIANLRADVKIAEKLIQIAHDG